MTLDQVRRGVRRARCRYLVDGVTKLEKVDYGAAAEPETFRKMLVATGNDVRVMSIKLADRLHNMRTLGVMRPEKQARIAKVTRDVLIPLAERLGVQALKTELEDLVFAILHPEEYAAHPRADPRHTPRAARPAGARRRGRTRRCCARPGISGEVLIRPRHFVSVHRVAAQARRELRGTDFGRLLVLVAEDADCYAVLGELHTCFTPVISEFKDFIAAPKFNLYQSLHTAIAGQDGAVAEVLIRTRQMHQVAEAGVIALGNPLRSPPDGPRDAPRASASTPPGPAGSSRLLDWQSDAPDPDTFWTTLRDELAQDREITVFRADGGHRSACPRARPVSTPRTHSTARTPTPASAPGSTAGSRRSARCCGTATPLQLLMAGGTGTPPPGPRRSGWTTRAHRPRGSPSTAGWPPTRQRRAVTDREPAGPRPEPRRAADRPPAGRRRAASAAAAPPGAARSRLGRAAAPPCRPTRSPASPCAAGAVTVHRERVPRRGADGRGRAQAVAVRWAATDDGPARRLPGHPRRRVVRPARICSPTSPRPSPRRAPPSSRPTVEPPARAARPAHLHAPTPRRGSAARRSCGPCATSPGVYDVTRAAGRSMAAARSRTHRAGLAPRSGGRRDARRRPARGALVAVWSMPLGPPAPPRTASTALVAAAMAAAPRVGPPSAAAPDARDPGRWASATASSRDLGNPGYDVRVVRHRLRPTGANDKPLDAVTTIDARDHRRPANRQPRLRPRRRRLGRGRRSAGPFATRRRGPGRHAAAPAARRAPRCGSPSGTPATPWPAGRRRLGPHHATGWPWPTRPTPPTGSSPATTTPPTRRCFTFRITAPKTSRPSPTVCPTGAYRVGPRPPGRTAPAHPMATELAQVSIGRSAVLHRTGPHGLPVRDVVPAADRARSEPWLARTPGQIAWMEKQGRPATPSRRTASHRRRRPPASSWRPRRSPSSSATCSPSPDTPVVHRSIMVHELAHQWFGDSVSPRTWSDLWLNEGHATWYEALYAEENGEATLEQRGCRIRRTSSPTPGAPTAGRPAAPKPPDAGQQIGIFRPQRLRRQRPGAVRAAAGDRRRGLRAAGADLGAPATATVWPRPPTSSRLASQVAGRDLSGFLRAWLYGQEDAADAGTPRLAGRRARKPGTAKGAALHGTAHAARGGG